MRKTLRTILALHGLFIAICLSNIPNNQIRSCLSVKMCLKMKDDVNIIDYHGNASLGCTNSTFAAFCGLCL